MFQLWGSWLFWHRLCWKYLMRIFMEIDSNSLSRTPALSWVEYKRNSGAEWLVTVSGYTRSTALMLSFEKEEPVSAFLFGLCMQAFSWHKCSRVFAALNLKKVWRKWCTLLSHFISLACQWSEDKLDTVSSSGTNSTNLYNWSDRFVGPLRSLNQLPIG